MQTTKTKERTHEAKAMPNENGPTTETASRALTEPVITPIRKLEAASLSLKPPVLRPLLPCPFTAWNGTVVSNQKWIDLYNRIQVAINRWLADRREPPEELLNSSHRTFVLIIEASAKDD
jgi:hypothetical protein